MTTVEDSYNYNKQRIIKIKYKFNSEYQDKHSIDLDTYQNSLKNIGSVIREANRITNGNNSDVQIDVLANKEGSFEVDLVINFIVSKLSSSDPSLILNFLGIAGNVVDTSLEVLDIISNIVAPLGLIGFIPKIGGRKILKEDKIDDDITKITTEDGESFTTNPEVIKYYYEPVIRDSLEKATECLKRKEIEDIEFSGVSEKTEPIIINKKDVEYFEYPENQKRLIDKKSSKKYKLEVLMVDFKKSDKWRFRDLITKAEFEATVEDSNYLQKINDKEIAFKYGTIIEVDLTVYTYEFTMTKRTKYSRVITKVYDLKNVDSHISEKITDDVTLDKWIN